MYRLFIVFLVALFITSCSKEKVSFCDEAAIEQFHQAFQPAEKDASCLWDLFAYKTGRKRVYTIHNPCIDMEVVYTDCDGEEVKALREFKFIERIAIQRTK